MFGNLFQENNKMKSAKRVPPPRSVYGLSGIENQGATCYLNTLLQTLLLTPEFRDGIFELEESELGSLNDKQKKGSKIRIIPLQLQRLFARLLLSNQEAASTSELTESFGWKHNEEMQQHDVQELNRILFSAIETSLLGTSGKNLISQLYHGSTVSQIVCQVCSKISEKEEDFLDLNITVSGFNSLQESLTSTFVHKEVMKGKNQYKCSMCCKLVDAKKGVKIRKLPPILTFSLLRFCFDLSKGERYKEKGKFIFPMEIDMAPYCDEQKNSEDTHYDLFSIVIHSGSGHEGHYHAYIRDFDCLGRWFPPDEECHFSSLGKSGSTNQCKQDPIELIVNILQQQLNFCLPLETLCSEMAAISGLSWNKRFKKHFGPLNKFLLQNDAIFFVNQDTNIVCLKEQTSDQNIAVNSSNSPISDTKDNVVSSKCKEPSRSSSFKSSLWDKKRSKNYCTGFGNNWFDFNDTTVKPINPKDIEKIFGGSESAYMLFYRRKSLKRPVAARENILYKIPSHLITLVNQENEDLQKMRNEYDAIVNSINLQIHFGIHHQYYQGALQPIPEMLSILELSIDKRKTLADLRNQIGQLGMEFCPESHDTIHLLSEVPAGLHLYEELSPSQDLENLIDLQITDGTKLFVWNGKEVGGEIILVGIHHEPILLNVTCRLGDMDCVKITRGFPKSMTLGELKVLLCDITPLNLEDIVISKVEFQNDDSTVTTFDDLKEGMSLIELNLLDGDNVLATSSCDKSDNYTKLITVIVENRCTINDGCALPNPIRNEVEVDPKQNISDLLNLLKQRFSLDKSIDYRVRKVADGRRQKPSIYLDLTLREAGIEDNCKLILEKGVSPKSNQVTLLFSINEMIDDAPAYEVTVSRKLSISECLKLMLKQSGLDGESWHLCKTSWCGEPTSPLVNENLSLEEEGVGHGDYLIILEGRLPPPGYLTLYMWLYETFTCNQNQNSNDTRIMNGECSGISHYYNYVPIQLGEVEISAESTLTDLKRQLLTLPNLGTCSLPGTLYLRLRLLEGNKPGCILRGHAASLRKLKLYNNQSIAVQILTEEEDLLQSEILLNVHWRISDLRTYGPSVEVVWETGKSANIKSLCQVVSEYLGVPADRFLLAKYFPETYEWKVINEITKNKVKKKWTLPKINLRQKPFYLKDGDIIGVKDSNTDCDNLYDFNTPEDDLKIEILRISLKESQKLEETWSTGSGDTDATNSSQPEVGLTIHVEDFN
ncbi:ubiquitin carboxyl-terminal hydrolase 40-like isoform X1 [Centruroides vittatus]|uniref:ubiquitin carboxyl-terminal hydrolase 40-like isoform X1 n=1 Tax=Centruroides vittatus TaxID=120091 RepID=UPI003510AFB0